MSFPKNRIYTAEAPRSPGINKATLQRWLKEDKIPGVASRGWRVVTKEEVARIIEYANTIIPLQI